MSAQPRPLKVFLCHGSGDKPAVRQLCERLAKDGFRPWLDEEDLIVGQLWEPAIRKAVRESDVVLVCLSQRSASKEGFMQKEIKFALDRADEKPEELIYVIPVRLEECKIPDRLAQWQWVNYYEEAGYAKLLVALWLRANQRQGTGGAPDLAASREPAKRRIEQEFVTDRSAARVPRVRWRPAIVVVAALVVAALLWMNAPSCNANHPVTQTKNTTQSPAVPAADDWQKSAEGAKQEGDRLRLAEKHLEAVAAYSKALQFKPDYIAALNNRAAAYNSLGQYQRAIEDLDQAIRLDPNQAEAYVNRGFAFNSLGVYQRAIPDLDQALRLKPDFAGAYSNRGWAYAGLHQFLRAVKDCDKAIQLDPGLAYAYVNRGDAYCGLRKYQLAIQDYDQAIRLKPDCPAYYRRGMVKDKLNDKSGAQVDWNRAKELGCKP